MHSILAVLILISLLEFLINLDIGLSHLICIDLQDDASPLKMMANVLHLYSTT